MLLLSWLNRVFSAELNSLRPRRSWKSCPQMLQQARHQRQVRVSTEVESSEQRLLLSTVSPIPIASATAPPIKSVTAQAQIITVTYCDDVAIQASDIGSGDIQVNGPNSYSQVATLVSMTPGTNASTITATYSITAPGGTWDTLDTGAYAIYLLNSQVSDSVNFVPAGQIGSFIVETICTAPDAWGYVGCQVPFQFQDISTTGARILTNTDNNFFQLSDAALGDFQFPFYGTTYTSLYVSSNGRVTFGSGSSSAANNDLTSSPQATIAGLWDDLQTSATGIRWRVTGTGNDQSLIIEWDRASYLGSTGTITFEMVLHETDGSILFSYSDLSGNDLLRDEGASATVGIKDTGVQGTRRLLISQDSGPNAFVGSGKSILIQRDVEGKWIPLGPFSATNGQTENLSPNNQIAGSVHTVIAHPTNSNIVWAGATNGGIWRTDNAQSATPSWRPLTDRLPSLSTGALAFDTADATGETVYAGVGRYSSFSGLGGSRIGLLRTRDGGTTWQVVDGGGTLAGKNISGLHVNGTTIVVSVNVADTYSYPNIGIFRSTDGGATFTQSSDGTNGLPGGVCYDLVTDPTNPSILYTSSVFSSGLNGFYKSVDEGATWSKVSTPAVDAFITNGTSNLEMAVGRSNQVYAAIINSGVLAAIFRSGDGGSTWTQMDTPTTNEGGTNVGLNPGGPEGPAPGSDPALIAGGQGAVHFSIVADPTNANIVYVGGDRQPLEYQFPTSTGANDYSGRLFRGNASLAAGSQWVHLTHSNVLGAAGGGTASSSAPHADSREMTFDAAGNLIETDDGGIYRRTSPRTNTGDWFGMIGNLQVAESHDVAWDSVSHVAMSGNQDTGTTLQDTPGSSIWRSLSTADGGDVLVVEGSSTSARYSSFQNLGGFRQTTWDASGVQTLSVFPALTVTSGSALSPAFRTPIAANPNTGALIIQGSNGVYESLDGGATIQQLSSSGSPGVVGSGLEQNAIVVSGYFGGLTNNDVLWVGAGNEVLLRSTAGGNLNPVTAPTTDSTIRDLTTDPANWQNTFVIDSNQVSATTDAGTSWADITGNLMTFASDLRSLAFVTTGLFDALVVGTNVGVYFSPVNNFGTLGQWVRLGANLPNAIVYDMEYDVRDDVLVVGTMGRGSWLLNDVAEQVMDTLLDFDYGDAPASFGIRKAQDGGRHVARGVTLGSRRDFEADAIPTANASGDDSNDLTDDEDGVTFLTPLASGATASIKVNVSAPGYVSVLVDLDLNGVWDDAGGEVISAQLIPAGDSTLSFALPSGMTLTPVTSWVRVLVTTDSSGGNYSGGAPDGEVEDYEVTILPEQLLTFSLGATTMSENGGLINGTVSLTRADLVSDTVVTLNSSDTTEATVPFTVTIPAGSISAPFLVTAVDDTLLDGAQSVTLTASSGVITPGTTNLTVTDYETLTLAIAAARVSENAGPAAVSGTVTRSNTDNAAPLTVNLLSSDTSEATVLGTMTIPGGSSSGTFFINAIDDALLDGTITVTISASATGYVGSSSTLDVRDNESALISVVESGGSTIVSEGGLSDSFTVVLNSQPDADVVITLSASNSLEVSLPITTLTFTSANWNTPQIASVNGVDDSFIDGPQVAAITVAVNDAASDVYYWAAPDVVLSALNQDNEVAGLIVVESGGTTVVPEFNGSDSVTVRLIDRPQSDVVLSVSVSDSTEAFVVTSSLRFTTNNWNTPQVVVVNSVDDGVVDGNIVSQLRFAVVPAQSNDNFDTMPDVTVNVVTVDNEVAGFLVTETLGKTIVDESGTTDTVLVRLLAAPASNVVFTVTESDSTEASVSPATLTFTAANWNVPQIVTVTGVNDLLFDKAQLSQLTIAIDPANSQDQFDTLPPSVISVTTTDNEPDPPTLSGPATDTRTHYPTFTWTPVPGAVSYRIWVASLQLPVQPPLIDKVVTGTSYTSPVPLEIARHRVWVLANLSTGISTSWSFPRTFDVRTPPVVQPLARFQDTYRPIITWTPVYKAASYQIQIDSRFTAPFGLIFQSNITSTTYTVPVDLPLGSYKVWVRALATNGNYSAWSSPGEFYVAVAPTPLAPGASIFDTTPTFRWGSVLGAREYHVRVFDMTSRQIVIDQTVLRLQDFTPTTGLALGQYRWNIQAGGENNVVGNWSAGQLLYIGGRSQVFTPVGPQLNNRPTFQWQSVDDAFSYSVYVVRTSGVAQVIQVNDLLTNSWTPTTPLAAGNYRVWVQAVSQTGQLSLWSLPVDFTIAANQLEVPDRNALPDGLLDDVSPVHVRSETGNASAAAAAIEFQTSDTSSMAESTEVAAKPAVALPNRKAGPVFMRTTTAHTQPSASLESLPPISRFPKEDESSAYDLVMVQFDQLDWWR